jgi:hypothetical protein
VYLPGLLQGARPSARIAALKKAQVPTGVCHCPGTDVVYHSGVIATFSYTAGKPVIYIHTFFFFLTDAEFQSDLCKVISQAWWHMFVILVLMRLRQEDYKAEASLGCLMRLCL